MHIEMPDRCVVYGCGNINDKGSKEKGISLHRIPFWEDERPEAKRRRKRWVDFVQRKRANFVPSQYSAVCSDHFREEDFLRKFTALLGPTERLQAVFKRDDFGILAFLTVYPIASSALVATGESTRPKPKRSRAHRQVNSLNVFRNVTLIET